MMMNEISEANTITSGLRLWLADDDDLLRGLIAELLGRSENVQCSRQFSSAEELLSTLQTERPPDLILLDLNMTGMSGIEAIGPIKRLASGTRVFIMTTFYDSMAVSSARAAGASGFILKRDDWKEVIERLQDESADWAAAGSVAVPLPSEIPGPEVWSRAFRRSYVEA